MTEDGKKKVSRSQAKKVVFRVYDFKNEKYDSDTLLSVNQKTSDATGVCVSVSTIERIVSEGNSSASENTGKSIFQVASKDVNKKEQFDQGSYRFFSREGIICL